MSNVTEIGLVAVATIAVLAPVAAAQESAGYRRPPREVVEVVDAPPTPSVVVSPAETHVVIAHRDALPSIAEVSEPMVRVAGMRIHPGRTARFSTGFVTMLEVIDLGSNERRPVVMDDGSRLSPPSFAPNGERFAFTRETDDGIELWVADVATASAKRLVGPRLNGTMRNAYSWWSGSEQLLIHLVPPGRGAAPAPPLVPGGPLVQESVGRSKTNRTYQDLLQNPYDEALFEHYCTAQLARVDLDGTVRPIGREGIFLGAEVSPDGMHLLVERVHWPYSYAVPASSFPHTIEVWDATGRRVHVVADIGIADEVPIGGVRTGPRGVKWHPKEGSTLVFVEAQDDGDPKKKVPNRDRVLCAAAPFTESREIHRTTHRYRGADWLSDSDRALISEYDRDRRWLTMKLVDFANGGEPVVVDDRSQHDRYGDPGRPVKKTLPNGSSVVEVENGTICLAGGGASAEGERPFLRRLDLATLVSTDLFRSPADRYTSFVGFTSGRGEARSLLLRTESPDDPPNYVVHASGVERRITEFPHPYPALARVQKEILRYERGDGVPLSGTLYLPPGYVEGTRLPLVMWAYPIEYNDAATAGQVRQTANRFTWISSLSPLMFLLNGYAVLDGAAMPVIGDPETMNDTFCEQIVAAAKAGIDACVARGVADGGRVGVGGHSYGAFMTANLLAHSDLFRAGIARSGAYNRSLTPFGFQSERRTVWEATETYVKVSPFFQADKIDEPILLIHGEVDDNSGTFPLQSKRLFHALSGLGGTVRYVLLPNESHGYRARESVLHVLAESFDWFDEHVKGSAPRPGARPAEEGASPETAGDPNGSR